VVGVKSDIIDAAFGVPQGARLSPFALLFINDLKTSIAIAANS